MRSCFVALAFIITNSIYCYSQEEVPVNMHTGTPLIGIPIHTIVAHDITEPIALSYNAKGIKLEQKDGWYGLGWNLNGGGAISREVRGLPDDFGYNDSYSRKGWLYSRNGSETNVSTDIQLFSNSADQSAGTCSDENTDFNTLNGFNYLVDTEPDLFYYNFAGNSGKFVFDNSGVIRMIPYQDVKIQYVQETAPNKALKSFTVTTNNGFIYTFSQQVISTRQAVKNEFLNTVSILSADYELYKNLVSYTTTWQLSRIDSPSGGWINFVYAIDSFTSEQPVNVGKYIALNPSQLGATDLAVQKLYTIKETSATRYLSSITSSSGSQLDFLNDSESLQKITVKDTRKVPNNYVKEFVMTYAQGSLGKFLTAITERSECDIIPPYRFSYIGMNDLPEYNSNSKDFWGYYNAANNTSLVPKLYVYPSEPASERYRLQPIPNYQGQVVILNGADRKPNTNAISIGTLNRITYPAGGILQLGYEPNEYYDARAGQSFLGGGLRVSTLSYSDGMHPHLNVAKTFTYRNSSNQSSGRLLTRPAFAIPAYKWKDPNYYNSTSATYDKNYAELSADDQWRYLTLRTEFDLASEEETNGGTVGYQAVTVKRTGAGSVLFEYDLPGVYGENANGNWSATQNRFARSPSCASMGILSNGEAWMYPFSRNTNFDHERGLVSKKSEYNEQGTLVRMTQYEYQYLYRLGATQPIGVAGLQYNNYALSEDNNAANKIFFYGKYFLITDVDRLLAKETVTIYDANNTAKSANSSTEYFYTSPYHKLLSSVRQTNKEGTYNTTRFKYPADYGTIANNSEASVLCLRDLKTAYRYNQPVEIVNSIQRAGGSENVLSASYTRYVNFPSVGIYPAEVFSLSTSAPLTNFVNSYLQLKSGTYQLTADTRYEKIATISSYAPFGQPVTQTGLNRIPSTSIYGYNGSLPVVQASNVQGSEIAFTDFDSAPGSDFTVANSYYGEGRTAGRGIHPYSTLTRTLSKAANADNYILSFWLKKDDAPVSYQVSIKSTTDATVYYTNTFTVAPVGTDFEYFRQLIPASTFPASFKVELKSTSFASSPLVTDALLPMMDDVAFYPETAAIVSYAYALPFGAKAVTNHQGVSSYTNYDKLGRVTYVQDRDKNILQKSSYNYSASGIVLLADFLTPEVIFKGKPAQFDATANDCATGVTYEWSFDLGAYSSGSLNQSYTFTSTGSHTVMLRVSHPQLGTLIKTQVVNVISEPIGISLCAKGVREYLASDNLIMASYACSSITDALPTSYGVIFRATVAEELGITYQWKYRDLGTQTWTNVGTNSNQYSIAKVLSTTKSFEVTCEVLSGDGRTGSSSIMSVIVY